ncbi:MAG: DUF2076 family protein [Zoogloea sp.]|nr:DUF2076 family protein [Zoogloea sp.]
MNIQEREKLNGFLSQLLQARMGAKDAEADALIRQACASQPDAAYLLVQRALLLEGALQDAQAQAARLQGELNQLRAGSSGGFLDMGGWGNSGMGQRTPMAPAPAAPASSMPAPSAPHSPLPGFLGNVATTAAGVVAGSFLFQGIEHLMGNHGNGWMSQANVQPTPALTENTVVNNYYDKDAGGDEQPTDAFDDGSLAGPDDWA